MWIVIAIEVVVTIAIIELDKRTHFKYKFLPVFAFLGVCGIVVTGFYGWGL